MHRYTNVPFIISMMVCANSMCAISLFTSKQLIVVDLTWEAAIVVKPEICRQRWFGRQRRDIWLLHRGERYKMTLIFRCVSHEKLNICYGRIPKFSPFFYFLILLRFFNQNSQAVEMGVNLMLWDWLVMT